MSHDFEVSLSRDEYNQLLLLMGYAIGAAHTQGDMGLHADFIHLANRLNRNNPYWVPYRLPDELNSESEEGEPTGAEGTRETE